MAPSNASTFLFCFCTKTFQKGQELLDGFVNAGLENESLLDDTGIVLFQKVDGEIKGKQLVRRCITRSWGASPFCDPCAAGHVKVWKVSSAVDTLRLVCDQCGREKTVQRPDWSQPLAAAPDFYLLEFPLTMEQASLITLQHSDIKATSNNTPTTSPVKVTMFDKRHISKKKKAKRAMQQAQEKRRGNKDTK
jgi:hypothetical protein